MDLRNMPRCGRSCGDCMACLVQPSIASDDSSDSEAWFRVLKSTPAWSPNRSGSPKSAREWGFDMST